MEEEPLILTELKSKHSGHDVIIPICIPHINYKTGIHTKAYFFLGNIPNDVYAAIKRGNFAKDKRYTEWSSKDRDIIKDYYGVHWKSYLTAPNLSTKEVNQQYSIFLGGSRRDNDINQSGDVFDFHAAKTLNSNKNNAAKSREFTDDDFLNIDNTTVFKKSTKSAQFNYTFSSEPVYSKLSIEKEDTIMTIKLKLQAISGIGIYRQHMFYYVNNEGPIVSYKIVTNDIPINVKWQDLNNNKILADIGMDQLLTDTKSCSVLAEDEFTSFNRIAGIFPNLYFIDFYSVFNDENPLLTDILQDKQQFTILYYGSIIKFWPMLTPEFAKMAIENPTEMANHSILNINHQRLLDKYNYINELDFENVRDDYNITVTRANIKVTPSGKTCVLNIRSIFDWLKTDEKIVAMKLFLDSDVTIKKVKRHFSSYKLIIRESIDRLLEYYLAKNTLLFLIRHSKTSDKIIIMKLMINGQYIVSSTWVEDDNVKFENIIKDISVHIIGTINNINKMGVAAFPLGGQLVSNSANTTLGLITCTIFWQNVISNSGFKELRNLFREYELYGIIEALGIQHHNSYIFNFKHNISNYDIKTVQMMWDKLSNSNMYVYLSSEQYYDVWKNMFAGRQVKILHRVTDIRIEIMGANHLDEFNHIKKFILSILENNRKMLVKIEDKVNTQNNLRKLQEQDPNLYDTKKYDKEAEVYARLCQSDRQPRILLKDEKLTKGVIKYWNFTTNTPAYYTCENKKYPNFGFTVEGHPKGFCLPCCRKSESTQNSKAENILETCLKEHKFENNDLFSKHILQYGKPIYDYRIADCPKEISDGILLNCIDKNYLFKLIGTKQSSKAIENAGYMYSIAHALSDDEMEIIDDIVEYVSDLVDFNTLGGGLGGVFSSSKELAECIRASFDDSEELTKFSVGGQAENWQRIIKDIVFDLYDMAVIHFEDLNENLSKEADTNIVMNITMRAEKIVLLLTNTTGTYLIGAMRPGQYLRSLKIDKWKVSRRWFCEDMSNYTVDADEAEEDNVDNDRILPLNKVKDTVYKTIYKFFKENDSFNIYTIMKNLHGYEVEKVLLNMKNTCYGVVLTKNGRRYYLPLNYSTYPDIDIDYEPRDFINTREEVDELLRDFSIKILRVLMRNDKECGYMLENKLCVYFELAAAKKIIKETLNIPYDQLELDKLIIEAARNDIQEPEKLELDFSNKLYSLFVIEFATIVKNNKNLQMREKISKIIESFTIKNAILIKEQLAELKLETGDINIIKDIIKDNFNDKKKALNILDDIKFDFDNILINELRESPNKLTKIKNIMGKVCIIDEDATDLSNIIVSCTEDTSIEQRHCKNHKLKISAKNFDLFCNLLIADIDNPSKHILLLSSSTILDPYEFIEYPTEIMY